MTKTMDSSGRQIVSLSWTERAVFCGVGTMLIAFLGWIGTVAWDTHNTVLNLARDNQFVSKELDDHEVRIRSLERKP